MSLSQKNIFQRLAVAAQRKSSNIFGWPKPKLPSGNLLKMTPQMRPGNASVLSLIEALAKKLNIPLSDDQKTRMVANFNKPSNQANLLKDLKNIKPKGNTSSAMAAAELLVARRIANAMLTGMSDIYQAGGLPFIVQINRGNLFDIPDQNPYQGGSNGPQVIDQEKNIDFFPYGDSQGLQATSIRNLMLNGDLDSSLDEWLDANGIESAPDSEHNKYRHTLGSP
jgi:hypothetical protein